MNDRNADVEALLGTVNEKPLSASQSMVLGLAAKEQARLLTIAEQIRRDGDQVVANANGVMNEAVVAIRKDFDIPVGIQVQFENVNEQIVMRWTVPAVEADPTQTKLALVKNDPPAADAAEGVATT